jgi:hypothetical protein
MGSFRVKQFVVREGSGMEMVCTQGAIWLEPAGEEAVCHYPWQERDSESDEPSLRGDPREAVILALYGEYRSRIYCYLRSMQLRHEEAEEIVQETFMRLTMEFLKETEIENMPGWIVGTTPTPRPVLKRGT